MKKHKHLSQKFQKKYFFFQKSFFDFLYWRSAQKAKPEFLTELKYTPFSRDFSAFPKSGKFEEQKQIQMELNSDPKFYPFEQEKMSFYQYWKRDSIGGHPKNIQNILKSSTKGTAIQPKSFDFFQKNKQNKSFSFLKENKNRKIVSNSKKSLNLLTTQTFHFLFLKKRKEKMTHFQKRNFKNESFLPITSSFEISQNLALSTQWTKSQKIGEFFPKKKNFMQYWIFPFLGVLFFFSQNVFFLQREKKFMNLFSFEPFQVLDTSIHPNFFSKHSSNQSQFFSKKNFLNFGKNEQSAYHKAEHTTLQSQIQPFEYFYAQKNFAKTEFFENLEKTEYEEFFKFYNQIFQNTLSSSLSSFYFTNSIHLSPFSKFGNFDFFQQNFQKNQVALFDSKRNSFNWKWFSLRINFLNPQSSLSLFLQIPQKAEFFAYSSPFQIQNTWTKSRQGVSQIPFFSDFENSIKKPKNGNIEKPVTPLLEYSKNLFLMNELKRHFHFTKLKTTFSSQSETVQNQVSFDLNQKEKLFACAAEKDFLLFLNNFEKMMTVHSVFASADDRNTSFLKKWAKTQKFSLLQKSNQKKRDKNISSQTPNSFFRIQKSALNEKKEKSFKKNLKQTKNVEISQKLMNLDALYFQKLFQKKLNIQNFENHIHSEQFQNSQKQFSVNKKEKKFFSFKKQTYGFFIFQHYNKNYKKFLNSFVSNSSLSKKFRTNFLFTFQTKSKKRKTISPLTVQLEGLAPVQSIPPVLEIPLEEKTYSFGQTASDLTVPSAIEKYNSPILFQFFQNPNFEISSQFDFAKLIEPSFLRNGGMDQKNERIEFQQYGHATKNLYPHNFYGQKLSFSFFPQFKEKNAKEFLFFDHQDKNNKNFSFNFFHKLDGFSTFQLGSPFNIVDDENFLKKNLYNFFSKVYIFQNFEKNFLFETNRDQKPLFFEKKKNFPFETFQNRKKDILFHSDSKKFDKKEEMSSCFYILKSKKRIPFLQYENCNKGTQSHFSGLSQKQRKFEKTFRAFFSPLKETKNLFSFGTLSNVAKPNQSIPGFSIVENQKQQTFYKKSAQWDSMTEVNKTLKDLVLLQNLSDLLKKNYRNFSHSFYQPTNRKSLKRKKNETIEQTPFLKEKTKMFVSFSQSPKQFEHEKRKKEFQKSHLSPQLVLKRDGFLSLSAQNPFLVDLNLNKYQEKKSFSLQRLEKEKSFQKKRRLKKEKLETRRRKKRKRFFPRPVWLRMNLYKKFLKNRHSSSACGAEKTFLFENKERNQFSFLPFKEKKSKFNFLSFADNRKNFVFLQNRMSAPFLTKKEKWFQKTEQKQTTLRMERYFSKKFISMNRNKAIYNQYGKKISRNSDFQNYNVDSLFFKKQNFNFQSKTYQKNSQKENWKKENSLFSLTKESEKFSKNVEHYKISNEIYQEFLRLSWKSSWFQNNFKPYTQTIQNNFQKIQSIESRKNLSNFFDILKSKNYIFFFHDFPIFSEKSINDFLIRKSVFQKFSWYSNIFTAKQSTTPFFEAFHLPRQKGVCPGGGSPIELFLGDANGENSLKVSEYNRILYARISEILKKMKFSENMTNDAFFESLKGNRRKNEKIFSGSKNSFFTKTALFLEKLQVPSQPVIPAFSVFSSLFNDFSIKPTGDIPTLRAMWAFQKTNFSHFQERNAIQNLWAFKKRKDALNSFKGTKKIMNFFRKYNGFEKLKMPKEFSSDWSLFAIPKHKQTLNTLLKNPSFSAKNFKSTQQSVVLRLSLASTHPVDQYAENRVANADGKTKNTMSKTFFLANKKNDFLKHSISAEGNSFLNQLDALTLKKFINVEKKSSTFGIQSFKQNSKNSYRYFKYRLFPFYKKNFGFAFGEKSQKKVSFVSQVEKNNEISELFSSPGLRPGVTEGQNPGSQTFFKNKNPQNSAKSSLNFWWAQKPFQNFDFLGSSQFQTFGNFSNSKPFSFVSEEKKNSSLSFEEQFFFSNISFLIFSAFFFHFAVFYTLFKIPEIRSVFKFTVLLFSKFLNSFFLVFFSIYNIFKKYTQNGFHILKTSSFSKNKKFQNGKKHIFSLNQSAFFSEKEFLNLLLPVRFSQTSFSFFSTQSTNGIHNGKNTKFEYFVFEFFPRFSSFSVGRNPFLSSSNKFPKKRKLFFHSPATDILFQKGNIPLKDAVTQKTNFREIFSKTNSLKNLNSVFVFQISQNEIFSKKAFFPRYGPNFNLSLDVEKPEMNFFVSSLGDKYQRGWPGRSFGHLQNSRVQHSQFSKTEKNLSQFALSLLIFGKQILIIPYHIFKLGSSISTKIFEIVEGIFYAFYKFLEKPAEFMIEFIAFVFLIEWSSDILGFFPDSIESSLWKSSQKLLRPVRTGTFFYSFGVFFFGVSAKSLSKNSSLTFQTNLNFSVFNPFQFFLSTGYFQFSNFAAYVLQKRLLYVFENVPSIFLQPDIDILVRQRKGIIFWDIWAEILLKAAEKYNVNLPSFVTLKEEQELFIEKLVHDSEFFKTFSHSPSNEGQNAYTIAPAANLPQQKEATSFSAFYHSADQNFVLQNRPFNFYDFSFLSQGESSLYSSIFQKSKNTEKLQQFSISNLFSSSSSVPIHLYQKEVSNSFIQKQGTNEKRKTFFPLFGPKTPTLDFLRMDKGFSLPAAEENLSSFQNMKKIDRWQCNQYSTFQSQETDFFLDIYPPKSLKHVHFLKYYEPAHYTLGSLICQIYAGIFPKQISKNILVVGESGTAKTFFLRALAGETEMKIITENASRYAIVQRGVAVGMKYLRDVFDAIALQTPCFFVMEDLHIIGAKRPFMISENENTQNVQSSFGLEQQEVHETNQMIYQSSRHSVSDFRRPYKGDFSMGIATNYFLQTFYSSFFSTAGTEQKKSSSQYSHDSLFYPLHKEHPFQNSQFFGGNFSSSVWNSLSSPLPIDSLEAILQNTGIHSQNGEKQKSHFESFSNKKNGKKIQSVLQFSKEQTFAPPATSPFTVLMMKEQKKLKPKKIVQETSWGGLSADQILLYQKESSSIRAKIAVLAEKTMNLSRGKFDMITDFLVIIDSVRSNRGFVVFGTTHKPSSLDPALRRPGRFDETLSLSRTPNFLNRFEIFKMNFENSVSTFDFFDASIFTENFSEMDLFDLLSQTKLSFFHNYKYDVQKFFSKTSSFSEFKKSENKKFQETALSPGIEKFAVKNQIYSQISPTKAFQTLLKSSLFEDFYTQKQFTSSSMQSKSKILAQNFPFALRNGNFFFNQSYTVLPKGPSHMVSLAYSKLGIFLAESNLWQSILPRQKQLCTGLGSGGQSPPNPEAVRSAICLGEASAVRSAICLGEASADSIALADNEQHGYPLPTAFAQLNLDIEKNSSKRSNFQQYYANVFFDPVQGRKNQKNLQLMVFLSGKIAEFFICSSENKNFSSFETSHSQFCVPNDKQTYTSSLSVVENSVVFEKPFSFFSKKFDIFESSVEKISRFHLSGHSFVNQTGSGGFTSNPPARQDFVQVEQQIRKMQNSSKVQEKMCTGSVQESFPLFKKDFYWTVYGNDETWRFATPFLHSLIQKRFLFTKNLLLSKMLFFENMDQRRKPPNPPASSILMPSKKYENFKRTETDFFQKASFSIHEKLQMHQKQRFLKQLYNIPVQTYFRSELRKNNKTLFSSSFQEFAYLDSFLQRSNSSHSYYKKYIQVRHRFSNVNQWWNGMFPEHTREMTYLSDVDWRTMFVSSPVNSQHHSVQTNQSDPNVNNGEILKNSFDVPHMKTFEFLMDFPDAEQYYNPRNRRWFFKSNINSQYAEKLGRNSPYWSIFEKDLQYEIFSHFLMESFYQSFSYFEKKREMLDFFAFHLLSKGFLKEIDFLTTFSRF
jgi:SpoVK/Ycf46/Vps4 family AAA+-type ATPase